MKGRGKLSGRNQDNASNGRAVTHILELTITLRDVPSPVWRRVQVPATFTLRRVHDVIQATMGWGGHHLHEFVVGDRRYGSADSMPTAPGSGDRVFSDRNVRLAHLVERGVDTFSYTYDFGDDWFHVVTIGATMPAEPGVACPRLVDARGACPPDDVGGPPGYEAFLEAIGDPGHPDHADMIAWLGTDRFDPAAVDVDAIEARLTPIRASTRKGPRPKMAAASIPGATSGDDDRTGPSADGKPETLVDLGLRLLRTGVGVADLLPDTAGRLVADPDAARALIGHVIQAGEPDEAVWALLIHVLEEARMDAEGDGTRGPAFLAAVEAAVEDVMADNGPLMNGLALVASAYRRAGLTVPRRLTAIPGVDTPHSPEEQAALEQAMDESITQMFSEIEDPFNLHGHFADTLAGVPDAGKGAIVARIAGRDEVAVSRLILYWLLDQAAEVRRAAAEALAERLISGAFGWPLMALLVAVRRWMPPDPARDAVDRALSKTRGGFATVDTGTRPADVAVIEGIATSVPDGTGAQQFAALTRRGDRHRLALVLLKTGHGVKDAFVLDDSSDAAREAYAKVGTVSDLEVDLETLATAIGAALGEGADLGRPPPPGLVDVLDALPLDTLDPSPATLEAWIDRGDPDGRIAAMTPQKRGRMVNESEDWSFQVPMVENWFEASGDLEVAVNDARTETGARRAVLTFLEDRRQFWAVQCFRGAHVLRGAMALRLAESFAAVGRALLEGRPLKKIPIIEQVVDGTLGMFEMADGPGGWTSSQAGPMAIDPESLTDVPPPDAEAMDRLGAYLDSPASPDGTLSLSGLDGFLHAVAIPAPPVAVEGWLSAVWDGQPPGFSGPDEAEDVLATIFGRYAQIIDHLSRGESRQVFVLSTDQAGRIDADDWLAGFVDGMSVAEEAWAALLTRAAEPLSVILAATDHPAVPPLPGLSEAERNELRKTLPEHLPLLVRSLWRAARNQAPGAGQ